MANFEEHELGGSKIMFDFSSGSYKTALTSFTSTGTAAQEFFFFPLLVEGHSLCVDPTVQWLRTCPGLSPFSLALTPILESAICCLPCFSFSSGISAYGKGVTHWDNHGVINNNLLSPCGLRKLINSAKEVNCDKETHKNSSQQA